MRNRSHLLRYSAIGLVAAGVAFAQATPPSGSAAPGTRMQSHAKRAAQYSAKKFDDISTLLNLTADQQTKGRHIFENAWNSAKPLIPQLRQNREAMKALIKSGNPARFNAEIEPLSRKEGALISDMIMIRTRALEEFYGILTPAQRTKAAALYSLMTTMPFRLRGAPVEPTPATPSE